MDFKKLLKKLMLRQNFITILLGIVLFGFLMFSYGEQRKDWFTLLAFVVAGLINISNGMKLMNSSKNKSRGMSLLLFGIILVFLGVILTI